MSDEEHLAMVWQSAFAAICEEAHRIVAALAETTRRIVEAGQP